MQNLAVALEDVEKLAENFHTTLNSFMRARDDDGLEEVSIAESEWLRACDIAVEMLESVSDPDISMGLHLHFINGCPWSQIVGELGIQDIEERCTRYLKGGRKL